MLRSKSSKIEKQEDILDSGAASTEYVNELSKTLKLWKLF